MATKNATKKNASKKPQPAVCDHWTAKVSDKMTVVEVLAVGPGRKGLQLRNVKTKKELRDRSAQFLRKLVSRAGTCDGCGAAGRVSAINGAGLFCGRGCYEASLAVGCQTPAPEQVETAGADAVLGLDVQGPLAPEQDALIRDVTAQPEVDEDAAVLAMTDEVAVPAERVEVVSRQAPVAAGAGEKAPALVDQVAEAKGTADFNEGLTEQERADVAKKHQAKKKAATKKAEPEKPGKPGKQAAPARERDPRLPAVGTVIRKAGAGGTVRCECTVVADGIRYGKQTYRTLSGAARQAALDLGLTSKAINGFSFWGLVGGGRRVDHAARVAAVLAKAEERVASALAAHAQGDERGAVLKLIAKHAAALEKLQR